MLLWLVGLATALDCYICNKTVKTVDRFTKEVQEEQVCTQDPADWDIETCSDPRHFCWKLKVQQDYFTTVYNRGCAIPQGWCFNEAKKLSNLFFKMCLPSPGCQTAWRNQGATPSAGTSLGKVDTTMVMIPVFAIQTFATLAPDILHHSPLHCCQL